MARSEKIDADLAEVSKQIEDRQVALEQLHREALAGGPLPVEELVRQVVRSGHGQAALRALQQALAAIAETAEPASARAETAGAGVKALGGGPEACHRDLAPKSIFKPLAQSEPQGGVRRLAGLGGEVPLSTRRRLHQSLARCQAAARQLRWRSGRRAHLGPTTRAWMSKLEPRGRASQLASYQCWNLRRLLHRIADRAPEGRGFPRLGGEPIKLQYKPGLLRPPRKVSHHESADRYK